MGNGENSSYYTAALAAPQPAMDDVAAPLMRGDHWSHFDNSVNAVSFGFVATAILISMFLVMAIFERFLRPRPTAAAGAGGGGTRMDLEAQMGFSNKLRYPSPKMTVYAKGVSVLMPGEDVPTFLGYPKPAQAPAPCPLERVIPPSHDSPPISMTLNLSSS